jgi:hypothetical protein
MVRVVLFALCLLAATVQAPAQEQTCVRCEYVDCIAGTIKQKEALRDGYLQLARKWEKVAPYTMESGQRVPFEVVDLATLAQSSARRSMMEGLVAEHAVLQRDEEEMAARIGPPTGCGYDPNVSVQMWTDTVTTCKTSNMDVARRAMPCKELADIALGHEARHSIECNKRKGDRAVPVKLQTPLGKAREEAQAYQEEIDKLRDLLERAKKKCRFRVHFQSRIDRQQGAAREWGQVRAAVTVEPASVGRGRIELASGDVALEYQDYGWDDPGCSHTGSGKGGTFRVVSGNLQLKDPPRGRPGLYLAGVDLVIDPGKTTEIHTVHCPRGPALSFPGTYWSAAFEWLHRSEMRGGGLAVGGWNIAADSPRATRTYTQAAECNNATCRETTTLELAYVGDEQPVALGRPSATHAFNPPDACSLRAARFLAFHP